MESILKFIESLEVKGYCYSTIKCYKNVIVFFLNAINLPPEKISESEIENYIALRKDHKKISNSFQKHLLFALKLFFKEVFNRNLKLEHLFPKNCKIKLPSILSKCEVRIILDSCNNLKHKAVLSTIYSSGLKLSEVVNLKLSEIDAVRMILNIKQSRGIMYRQVPLSEKLYDLLGEYCKIYKPKEWLFEGLNGNQYSKRSVQQAFDNSVFKSKIKKRTTIHTLRHSYAVHLVECGIHIRIIQKLLGHNSIMTTKIYTRIAAVPKFNIQSPLDTL